MRRIVMDSKTLLSTNSPDAVPKVSWSSNLSGSVFRAAVMMKLQCAEFLAAFEGQFGFKIFQVATNTRNSSQFIACAKNHTGVFCLQISRYAGAIARAAVTNIANGHIEMIAPEKWRTDERLACAENVARRSLPLPFCHHPVLHTNATCARIGPPRDIAGGKDSWDICFQKFVD